MTNNANREAFEAWLVAVHGLTPAALDGIRHKYGYLTLVVKSWWEGWQARQPEIDALHARIAELEAQVAELQTAEWWYGKDAEYGSPNINDIINYEASIGLVSVIHGMRQETTKYVAGIVTKYNNDGFIDEYHNVVFDTLEEAEAAVAAMPKPPTKEATNA